jgi:pyruvate kinase
MIADNRRTKIIATLGPATDSPEMLEKMVEAGMNVARINMSHAREEAVRNSVSSIREISDRLGKTVAILMDLQGPAIRTGEVSSALNLTPGQKIALTVRGEQSEEEHSVDVNYDQLVEDIKEGDVVLVDNGTIQLRVLQKKRNQLQCEVLTEGVLGSRRHINLPGVRVNLPALTDKDMKDVDLGIEVGVDWIAMSFCRQAEDLLKLRAILDYHKAPQKIVAKLEDQEGVKNLQGIIENSDGVMVARGDLGIEIPYEDLPIVQRRIVKACQLNGTPVIVATHMLESMIENPMPTRAEITDVSNAIYEQADAIMLSGETSVGQYPLKCIEIMDRIARRTERSGGAGFVAEAEMNTTSGRLMKSASVLAREIEAAAMIVFTKTGGMARSAAWQRNPHCPVYAFADNVILRNQLMLLWGVEPFFLQLDESNPMENVDCAIEFLMSKGLLSSGDEVVSVTEVVYNGKIVDSIQMEAVS